jgi:hypothetical protein
MKKRELVGIAKKLNSIFLLLESADDSRAGDAESVIEQTSLREALSEHSEKPNANKGRDAGEIIGSFADDSLTSAHRRMRGTH